MADDDQQHPNSSIDHQKIRRQETMSPHIIRPETSSLSPKKRVFHVQETDDHPKETSSSLPDASTDCGHDHKKSKTITNIDDQGAPVCSNPRIIKLFGVNIMVMSSDHSKSIEIDDADDDDYEKKRSELVLNNPNVQRQEQPITHDDPVAPPLFHPRILQEIRQHEQPVFLFEKKLESSDIARGLNRLYITRSDELMGFLTEEERRKVEDKDDNLVVITRDNTKGFIYTLHLTRWHSVDMIVLKHDWCKLVAANALQKGDSVRGWGYRRGSQLQLAVDIIRKEE